AGELPLADHAPRVEVVVLVPAVVLDLATALGLDHGEEQRPELDRVVLHAGDGHRVSPAVARSGRGEASLFLTDRQVRRLLEGGRQWGTTGRRTWGCACASSSGRCGSSATASASTRSRATSSTAMSHPASTAAWRSRVR